MMLKKFLLTLALIAGLMNISVPQSFATVSSTTNQVIYNGDGVTSTFAFSFNVFNSASENDLVVSKQNTTTGQVTTLALTTDYTVSLTHTIPTPGSITLVAGALASGYKLSILRTLPLTQNVRIADNSATPAATTNSVYDRLVMSDQQLQQQLTRAILQNAFSTTSISLPAGVAGLVLCWDSTATTLTNCAATSTQAVPVPIPNSYLSTLTSSNLVDGSSLFNLANIVSGAGIIPVANTPFGTTANKLVKLDSSAKLPAVDGSALTNLPIPSGLGSWTSKSITTVYQAATDGFMAANAVANTSGTILCLTDSSNPPTTVRTHMGNGSSASISCSSMVKKNDYYEFTSSGTIASTALYFISIGS